MNAWTKVCKMIYQWIHVFCCQWVIGPERKPSGSAKVQTVTHRQTCPNTQKKNKARTLTSPSPSSLPLSNCIWAKCLNQSKLIRQTKCILGKIRPPFLRRIHHFHFCLSSFFGGEALLLDVAGGTPPPPPGSRILCCVSVNILFCLISTVCLRKAEETLEILDFVGIKQSKYPNSKTIVWKCLKWRWAGEWKPLKLNHFAI